MSERNFCFDIFMEWLTIFPERRAYSGISMYPEQKRESKFVLETSNLSEGAQKTS